APVARAAEILRRIETETTHHAHRTRTTAVVSGANRLRCVFDHGDAALFADLEDRIHRRALTVDVDGHDCFSAWCDRVGDSRRIEVVSFRIDVDEHRTRAESRDTRGGREE